MIWTSQQKELLSIGLKENLPIETVAKEDHHKAVDLARQVHRHLEKNCDLGDIGSSPLIWPGPGGRRPRQPARGRAGRRRRRRSRRERRRGGWGRRCRGDEGRGGDQCRPKPKAELDPVHLVEVLQQFQSNSVWFLFTWILCAERTFLSNLSFEASDQRAIDNPSHKSRDSHHCCHNSCLGFVKTRMEAMVMLKMLLCVAIMMRMLIVYISVACMPGLCCSWCYTSP